MKLEGQYVITELHIQFQGGFAGRDCVLQGLEAGRDSVLQGSETSKTEYKKMLEFYPGDSNSLQVSFIHNAIMQHKGTVYCMGSETH